MIKTHSIIVALVFLTSLLPSASVFAQSAPEPSFDCGKATLPVEKAICENAELASLDRELAAKFNDAKQANSQNSALLLANQRQWLKTRVTECSGDGNPDALSADQKQINVLCLRKLYLTRITALSYPEFLLPPENINDARAMAQLRTMNPQDLYDITNDENRDTLSRFSCQLFEQNPTAASKIFAAYFGSSMDDWNPICNKIDIADRVPEVATLLDALKPIWGANTGCGGTIQSAYARTTTIIRILAAVDPDPMKNEEKAAPLDANALGYTPDLQHWAQQGQWEKRQYEALLPLIEKAQAALSQYYQNRFQTKPAQADEAARFHVTQMIRDQTEHSGASSTTSYLSLCFTKTDLDRYLTSHEVPTKTCPYGQFADMSREATLRRLLGLAIVHHYPLDAIKTLIADGAELNQKRQSFGGTFMIHDSPLMLAAPDPDMVDVLVKAGADVNEANDFGKTALMYAVQERKAQSVSALLNAGANVNAKTFDTTQCTALKAGHRTALMYAAWQSTPDVIKLLVEAGADVKAVDTNNETALDYLKRNETLNFDDKMLLEGVLKTKP